MSRRRYLSSKISTDVKVNALAINSGPMAALLYTWMIPHAEDDGTLTADPQELLLQVIPGQRQVTAEEVADYIAAMLASGLLIAVNDRLAFPPDHFYRYQTYVSESRRGTANISAEQRVSAQISANQRSGEGEGKGKVQVKGEGERYAATKPPQSPTNAGLTLTRTPITLDVISGFVTLYAPLLGGEEVVRQAVAKCMGYQGFERLGDKVGRVKQWLDDDVARHDKERANGHQNHTAAGKPVRGGARHKSDAPSGGTKKNSFAARTQASRDARMAAALAEAERAGFFGDAETATGPDSNDSG